MVAARELLARSVSLSRSLPPAPFGAPLPRRLRAEVCAREGEGVGGVGGGARVPGRPADGGAASDAGKPWTSRGCWRR